MSQGLSIIILLSAAILVSGCVSQSSGTPEQPSAAPEQPSAEPPSLPEGPASPEQVQTQEDIIKGMAVSGTSINIRDCDPEPMVLKVPWKTEIKIQNPDDVFHRIFIEGNSYRIGENSFLEFFVSFSVEREIYNYHCDETQNAGYIVIEE